MSCCGPQLSEEEKEQARINKQIQKQLQMDQKTMNKQVKILLLGAGESGKSTIAKQMRIIHEIEFTDEEKEYYKSIIFDNTYSCMKTILTGGRNLSIDLKNQKLKPVAESIVEGKYEWNGVLTLQIAADLSSLWSDKGLQEMYNSRSSYQLPDCAEYYLRDIERLAQQDYIPGEQDILRSRVATTGVIETRVKIEDIEFLFVDVGGQKSERKKWVLCFPDVTAILFCAALNGYDLLCMEDNKTNRMTESVELFSDISNSKWFIDTPIMLFLNKSDLFKEKIERKIPITIAFPEYEGNVEYQECIDYIFKRFFEVVKQEGKSIYPHVTCATDTDNIQIVWQAVQDIILTKVLNETGFDV